MIVSRFVVTDIAPVDRFSCYGQIPESIHDARIDLLGVSELLVHERDPRDAHLEPRAKPIFRQIAFDAIAFDTGGIHDQHRGCPDGFETLEVRRMLLDVSFQRNKILMDEVRDFLIRVGLGFQPSTGASGGRGREIDQQRFVA